MHAHTIYIYTIYIFYYYILLYIYTQHPLIYTYTLYTHLMMSEAFCTMNVIHAPASTLMINCEKARRSCVCECVNGCVYVYVM
jgi:hypothetical protein